MFAIPLSRGKIATSEFWIPRPTVTDRGARRPRLTKIAQREKRVRTHTRICTIRQGCICLLIGYDQGVSENPEMSPPESGRRWESLIWPRWLPIRARLPLIAQFSGAGLLLAAIAMPNWSAVAPADAPGVVSVNAPTPAAATPAPAATPAEPARPAHLNLDVRHSFGSVDLSVTVDGKRALDTKIAGTGKKFGMFGKRGEKGFTATLDLDPGARVVRVRVRSATDKFDQTRVERFDLESASVASMRIVAEKAGLSVFADRPPARQASVLATPSPPGPATAPVAQGAPVVQQQQMSAAAELYQALRQSLIAIAGFVASAATGYLVQEFLRSRKGLLGL